MLTKYVSLSAFIFSSFFCRTVCFIPLLGFYVLCMESSSIDMASVRRLVNTFDEII